MAELTYLELEISCVAEETVRHYERMLAFLGDFAQEICNKIKSNKIKIKIKKILLIHMHAQTKLYLDPTLY